MKLSSEECLVLAASAGDARMRLDQFLAAKVPQYSRSLLGKFIKSGAITTHEGRRLKPAQLLTGTEVLHLVVPPKTPSNMKAENIALDIVYSDEHLAVINKHAGLIIHPGAGAYEGTLCNALLYHFPDMVVGNVQRPGIVHRLDKDTSGLIVIAKTETAHRHLSEQFKNRSVKKIYRVFCFGEFLETKFDLKTGHARHLRNRLRFSTKLSQESCNGQNVRFAHTSFRVEKNSFGLAMLTAELHTGRTHQIRAHLADIDHPLLGDDLYGGKRALSARVPDDLRGAIDELKGQALHAETLGFTHPISKEPLHFTSKLPPHLARISSSF